jgi:hypothetical protein
LTHPAAVTAATGGQPLDIEWLLARHGMVYLLGGDEAALAPLVCALTVVLSPRDRALAAAQLNERRTGALPSVRELESQAQVSRGTAHTALQELRARANGLHVVTDTEQNRPDQ